MKLNIDTSHRDRVILEVDGKKYEAGAKKDKSQKLLPFITEVLEKEGKTMDDLTKVEVNTGPGSFTGLRVGVAVAQTLGWVLDIPVNGKRMKKGEVIEIDYEENK
ncbi:tRNA (adenosine(37)-N6)-threonylcarbamoyltransferase complex dimerization subunit type 1 TsaB [Patescibacteria group bacterium]